MSGRKLQVLELQLRCTISPELEALVGTMLALAQPARSTLGRGRTAMRFGLSDALRARAAVGRAFDRGEAFSDAVHADVLRRLDELTDSASSAGPQEVLP